jgi:hypothetical protein
MTNLYGQITRTEEIKPKQENDLYNLLLERVIDYNTRPLSTTFLFLGNKQRLKNVKDGTQDKIFHARANAQAGQIYDIPTAMGLSLGREAWDLLRKNTWERKPETKFLDTVNDSTRDLQADFYGLGKGILNPFSNVDNILDYEYLDRLNH